MATELQQLFLLLDKHAPSFCFYEPEEGEAEWMPLETLRTGIRFAETHSLGLHIIYGKEALPIGYETVLAAVPHIRIRPYQRGVSYCAERDIVVADSVCETDLSGLDVPLTHLILRIPLRDAHLLYAFIEHNYPYLKRLSVIFRGIEQVGEEDLNRLRLTFCRLRPLFSRLLMRRKQLEISFLTDRMLLSEMNNCNAGRTHLTLAPDGQFYVCPGFYYAGQPAVGDCKQGIHVPNAQLFRYDHAPICRRCDCYQCKRCVYLNWLTTGEVNTPSHEQCVVSHHERNLSGFLLQRMHERNYLLRLKEILPLYYTDPLELFDK